MMTPLPELITSSEPFQTVGAQTLLLPVGVVDIQGMGEAVAPAHVRQPARRIADSAHQQHKVVEVDPEAVLLQVVITGVQISDVEANLLQQPAEQPVDLIAESAAALDDDFLPQRRQVQPDRAL